MRNSLQFQQFLLIFAGVVKTLHYNRPRHTYVCALRSNSVNQVFTSPLYFTKGFL